MSLVRRVILAIGLAVTLGLMVVLTFHDSSSRQFTEESTVVDAPVPAPHFDPIEEPKCGEGETFVEELSKCLNEYERAFGIPEPHPPVWVHELEDGTFACDGWTVLLIDHETVPTPNGGQVSLTVNRNNTITHVDFQDWKSGAVGVIVGKRSFATVPPGVSGAYTSTLELSDDLFPDYADGVTLCTSVPWM